MGSRGVLGNAALIWGFPGRLLSDWLSVGALIRVTSGLGSYSTRFRSAFLWVVLNFRAKKKFQLSDWSIWVTWAKCCSLIGYLTE